MPYPKRIFMYQHKTIAHSEWVSRNLLCYIHSHAGYTAHLCESLFFHFLKKPICLKNFVYSSFIWIHKISLSPKLKMRVRHAENLNSCFGSVAARFDLKKGAMYNNSSFLLYFLGSLEQKQSQRHQYWIISCNQNCKWGAGRKFLESFSPHLSHISSLLQAQLYSSWLTWYKSSYF